MYTWEMCEKEINELVAIAERVVELRGGGNDIKIFINAKCVLEHVQFMRL